MQRKQLGESLSEQTDEMMVVGHPERPNLAVLFTTNGKIWYGMECQWNVL